MTPSITQAQRDANTKAFEQGLGSYSVTMNSTQNQNQNQNPLSTQNHQTTFSHPYQSPYESPYHPQQHERIPTMITTELMCINRKIDRLEYAIENLPVRICQILLPKLTTPESTKKIVEEVFDSKIATLMKDVLGLRKNNDGGAVPLSVTATTTTTTSNENVNTNPLNTGNVIKSFPVVKKAKVVAVAAAPAPVTVLEDPSSPYKSFVWGGAVHFIPEKYSIPLCHTKQLWILWVFGDSLERIRPLRTIPRTSFCKRERTVMSKIDFVMDFFMTQIGRRYTDIVESGPENAASLFSFSYDFVFDDHKKCDTMNYIAVYNILKRRLKDSDESELDEDIKLLKKEFHDEYYE